MSSFARISVLIVGDQLSAFAMYLMMNYLTDVWNLSITHAGGIINIWDGITPALVIVFSFFVDTFMGDYYMLVLSSILYTIGLGFLSMSTPPVLGPCSEYKAECVGYTQKVLFFTALGLITVGIAGHEVSLISFFIDQVKREDAGGDHDMLSRSRILVVVIVIVVTIGGGIARPFSMPWSIRFFVPSIFMLVATLLFLSGCVMYKRSKPEGSPLTITFRVFVAAARKMSLTYPDPEQLYNNEDVHITSSLRFLDKAAIRQGSQLDKWKICSVHEVEDTKIGIRMVPMWLTFIVIGVVLSIGNTYFLEQANRMDRKLGKIKIPIPFFLLLYICSSSISSYVYSLLRISLPSNKYAPPVGIATAMVCSVLCCITAAKVEARRLLMIRDHGLLDKPDETIPMGVLWLLPQFVILAAVDGIANTSITGFFKHQAPKSMRKYLMHFTKGVLGLGTMAGVLSVNIAGKVSERNQKLNWFQYTLDESRFDRYYWTLAGLSAANLLIYVIISSFYNYKETLDDEDDEYEEDRTAETELVYF